MDDDAEASARVNSRQTDRDRETRPNKEGKEVTINNKRVERRNETIAKTNKRILEPQDGSSWGPTRNSPTPSCFLLLFGVFNFVLCTIFRFHVHMRHEGSFFLPPPTGCVLIKGLGESVSA